MELIKLLYQIFEPIWSFLKNFWFNLLRLFIKQKASEEDHSEDCKNSENSDNNNSNSSIQTQDPQHLDLINNKKGWEGKDSKSSGVDLMRFLGQKYEQLLQFTKEGEDQEEKLSKPDPILARDLEDDNKKTPVIAPHVVAGDISASQGEITQIPHEADPEQKAPGIGGNVATEVKFWHKDTTKDVRKTERKVRRRGKNSRIKNYSGTGKTARTA